jgi:hypothetical protein
MEICNAEGKKLEESSCQVVSDSSEQNHRLYCNIVKVAEATLEKNKNLRVCGTVQVNRALLSDLLGEAKLLNGKSTLQRKKDMLLQVWQDKREVRIISSAHIAKVICSGKRDRKTRDDVKKPHCIVQYTCVWKELIGQTTT